jgi:Rhs element Vgr protein
MATLEKPIIENTGIVTFLIKVANEAIDKKFQVLSITVETGINKIPAATIVINDGDASLSDFEHSNSGVFVPGREIEIQLGYQKNNKAQNTSVFKGLIIKNSHKINNHCSELTIDCKHKADILTYTKDNRTFNENETDTDIIKKILDSHNKRLDQADIKTSDKKSPQLMQVNTTDWDFIMSRLDNAVMICTFPDSKMTMAELTKENAQTDSDNKSNAAPGQTPSDDNLFTLTFGKNILEFDGELDPRVESSMVKVVTWNYRDQKPEDTEAENDQSKATNDKSSTPKASGDDQLGYTWLINSSTFKTEEQRKAITDIKIRRQQLSKIKGTAKYLGNTIVSPGTFIKISGVGKRFDGKAFVTNILHEYTDGCWITTATLGWDEKLFTEQTNGSHPASAMGQSSSLQGLQIGKVTGIEDADGDYRVKVKLPMVDNTSDGIYARVATLDAGKDRGTFFRPEVDDEVVLGFISDDPANPVIVGMLHSSKLSAPLEPEKNNHKKGYVSRSAIKLIFNDDEKSLRIETPGNRVFEMNDKEGTISVTDKFENKITMDKSGITIDSSGDITMKAKKAFLVDAGTQLDMKAKSTAKMEGNGPVTIQSSANTVVKGSMVMIN